MLPSHGCPLLVLFFFFSLLHVSSFFYLSLFFFLNDPAPPEIYPLPLHDALPIWRHAWRALPPLAELASVWLGCRAPRPGRPANATPARLQRFPGCSRPAPARWERVHGRSTDRKSTRLNSSH